MGKKLYTRTLTLPNGKRKYFRATTEKEVEQKLLEAKLALNQGVDISDSTTVTELAQLWFDAYKRDQLHQKSQECIKGTLNRYILPRIGEMQVKDVKPLHAQMLLQSVSKLSQSTQRKVLNNAKALFQMAVDNGLILRSPFVSSIKVTAPPPKKKEALTRAQVEQLLEATQGTRAYPFILLALFGGLRKGEVLGTKWEDFDYAAGTVSVRRSLVYPVGSGVGVINEELKTEAAHRTVPLPVSVMDYFKAAQAKSKSEYVLSMTEEDAPLTAAAFRNLWNGVERRSAKSSENTTLEKTFDFTVHPHLLRHTCITRWYESGLDIKEVQYLAGHTTVGLTLDVYTHYTQQERAADTARHIHNADLGAKRLPSSRASDKPKTMIRTDA